MAGQQQITNIWEALQPVTKKHLTLDKETSRTKDWCCCWWVFLFILQYASLTYKQVTASQCKIARLFSSSCLLPDNYTEAQVMFGPHHRTLVTDLTVHYNVVQPEIRRPTAEGARARRSARPSVQGAEGRLWRGQLLQLGGVSLWRSQLLGSCFLASTAVLPQGSEDNVPQAKADHSRGRWQGAAALHRTPSI